MELLGKWFSRGKLLITGEYLVMEGAHAFAVPLKKGQGLEVYKTEEPNLLRWEAYAPGFLWFSASFSLPGLKVLETDDTEKAALLKKLLESVRQQKGGFLNGEQGYYVRTQLDFLPRYGFGTSSTLINNLALWADVDPYAVLFQTMGGSGYDIACASADTPGIYHLEKGTPVWQSRKFTPPFAERLHLVYLGNKQSSRKEIKRFKQNARFSRQDIETVSKITGLLSTTGDFYQFKSLLEEHEAVMARVLNREPVKNLRFRHLDVTAKSLGAWGGDFVLIASEQEKKYLYEKLKESGYLHIFAWKDLVV